jgi:hypothetical protein
MFFIKNFIGTFALLAETGMLFFLLWKVIRYRRREHLIWIGLMLAGRLVSLASMNYYIPLPLPLTARTISAIFNAVNWVGRFINVVGIAALTITISRLISRPEATTERRPTDPAAWPPAPSKPE